MANNYMLFSATITDLTQEEYAWLLQVLELVDVDDLAPAERAAFFAEVGIPDGEEYYTWPLFNHEFRDEGHRLWFYAEESFDPDAVGAFLHRFMKKHDREGHLFVEWADTCSKMRINAFGGGAVVATKTGWETATTGWIAAQLAKKLLNTPK